MLLTGYWQASEETLLARMSASRDVGSSTNHHMSAKDELLQAIEEHSEALQHIRDKLMQEETDLAVISTDSAEDVAAELVVSATRRYNSPSNASRVRTVIIRSFCMHQVCCTG